MFDLQLWVALLLKTFLINECKNQYRGLDPAEAEKLASLLNELLTNYQLFYVNARGFHWSIRGEKFLGYTPR
jgi:hypothetical protein